MWNLHYNKIEMKFIFNILILKSCNYFKKQSNVKKIEVKNSQFNAIETSI